MEIYRASDINDNAFEITVVSTRYALKICTGLCAQEAYMKT